MGCHASLVRDGVLDPYTDMDDDPGVLRITGFPPSLRAVYLESNPINTLQDAEWTCLVQLFVVNSTESVDMEAFVALTDFIDLSFRSGPLGRWSAAQWTTFQRMPNPFRLLDLATNGLTIDPWLLAHSQGVLDVSSNPIAVVPEALTPLLTTGHVVVSNTTYCNMTNHSSVLSC
ncbi:hypothetical protein DYB28_005499 [Aphanomyces astaci]|uniref:Uncharacterized protein n=1 Tax=Aphanomyces astaci TaxID=112090 RepID=A0A9X8H2T6_APHAT|nr:hypothetical protein DYB28_005499 [Aphanomyces astaci]